MARRWLLNANVLEQVYFSHFRGYCTG